MEKSVRKIVLDKGHVDLMDHMGSDLTVCNAARVSFNKESEWEIDTDAMKRLNESGSDYRKEDLRKLSDKDQKLLAYLAKYGHWTPFAHPQITLRIKAPISIRTQFFKHKVGFTENEISRRYVTFEPEIYMPRWRGKPTGGAKQGSDTFIEEDFFMDKSYKETIEHCLKTYESLISDGIAPEQARFVLPQGTYTEWYWTGSLSAYARFFKQRIDDHAQWEIRQYADVIGQLIEPLFPYSWKVLTTKQ